MAVANINVGGATEQSKPPFHACELSKGNNDCIPKYHAFLNELWFIREMHHIWYTRKSKCLPMCVSVHYVDAVR